MGLFRFRRSLRIAPGLRLNIGKRSTSLSVGARGAHVTIGNKGTRTTVGIPGTGLSYTDVAPRGTPPPPPAPPATNEPVGPTPAGNSGRGLLWLLAILLIAAAVAWRLAS
jgi:hypothetical protein